MGKSDTIRYREFIAHMETLINNSGLPAFVMIPILRETLRQLSQLDERQYQKDMQALTASNDKKDSEVNADGGQENQ